MDDAWSLDAPDAAQAARAMRQQRMHQRVFARRGSGMHDHARRFVDREHVLVLENHVERNVHGA